TCALPIYAGAPEAIAADVPVVGVAQPVAEAILHSGTRYRIYRVVLGDQSLAHVGDAHVPGLDGPVDEGGVGALVVGVAVLDGAVLHEQLVSAQRGDDVFVSILAEAAGE